MDRNALLESCRRDLDHRRRGCLAELANLDEAAARETKSSAGDKYETAREMIAQSRNLVGRTLAETESALQNLDRMAAAPAGESVGFGSLVETTAGWFLVGVSLGEVVHEEAGANQGEPAAKTLVKTLSLASPLGQALKGRKAGESVAWKGTNLSILEIRA